MGSVLVSAATDYPVSLAEAKARCAALTGARDAELELIRLGCIRQAERFMQRALMQQTWRDEFDCFSDAMELARGPVVSVSSVTYLDTDNAEQTLSNTVYYTDLVSSPQRVLRNPDQSWPSISDRLNAVRITYVANYAPADLLHDIKPAILDWIAVRFDNPGAAMPDGVRETLNLHRKISI